MNFFSVFLVANKQVEYSCEKLKWQITRQMSSKKQENSTTQSRLCNARSHATTWAALSPMESEGSPKRGHKPYKDFTQIVIIHQAGYFWKETSHTKLNYLFQFGRVRSRWDRATGHANELIGSWPSRIQKFRIINGTWRKKCQDSPTKTIGWYMGSAL